ncbi:hypothetical protein [Pilimelia anulata]|uniref:hypothetical protein n=1 Tax=Pilimelia anulata TaxID=53371 RepID=UPI00166C6357|nr:hypothetical protein [Pilimelia anulata]
MTALWIVTWVAIVLLFLAVGAVARELRLLRERLDTAASASDGYVAHPPAITLDPAVVPAGGVVIAADVDCPLCAVVADLAVRRVRAGATPPALLTHQSPDEWPAEVVRALRLVRSDTQWREVAHLTPPAVMRVAGDGRVTELVLPSTEAAAREVLGRWLVPAGHDVKAS